MTTIDTIESRIDASPALVQAIICRFGAAQLRSKPVMGCCIEIADDLCLSTNGTHVWAHGWDYEGVTVTDLF